MTVLEAVTPNIIERDAMQDTVKRLMAAIQQALGDQARVTVQGSIAKGTWLAGSTDVDVFMLFPPDSKADIATTTQRIGRQVLDQVQTKYAQHPYIVGRFDDIEVDLVPAYDVPPDGRMTAVDRTPHHTRWVLEHLDGREGEVRLAKQWCKGVGVYGADTASAGFSGYLVEVLVLHLGDFEAFIDWLAADARPRRIALGQDAVEDDVSPLVVVDPVDPTRNCGAAVSDGTLEQAVEAARAYRQDADDRFFFPVPPSTLGPDEAAQALREQGATWVGLLLRPRTDRLDIVLPQFQKAARAFGAAAHRAGFRCRRLRVDGDTDVLMQWVFDDAQLPPTRLHAGPLADDPNAKRFLDKWEGHADAVGPVREEAGRLCVELQVRARTPAAWFDAERTNLQGGKHVTAALADAKVLGDPSGCPAPWVTDFILDQRPWQR